MFICKNDNSNLLLTRRNSEIR